MLVSLTVSDSQTPPLWRYAGVSIYTSLPLRKAKDKACGNQLNARLMKTLSIYFYLRVIETTLSFQYSS